jgi:hypothetical protein
MLLSEHTVKPAHLPYRKLLENVAFILLLNLSVYKNLFTIAKSCLSVTPQTRNHLKPHSLTLSLQLCLDDF